MIWVKLGERRGKTLESFSDLCFYKVKNVYKAKCFIKLNVLISQDSPHKEKKRSLYPNNYGISFLQHSTLTTLKAGIKEKNRRSESIRNKCALFSLWTDMVYNVQIV